MIWQHCYTIYVKARHKCNKYAWKEAPHIHTWTAYIVLAKCQRSHLMCSAIQMYIMCVFLWKICCLHTLADSIAVQGILWLKNSSLPVDLIVLSCKSVQINYNAVFNTLSSWALSVWQFSVFWYMYTDLVTIASLSSKSLFVYRLRQICECWLKNPWHLAK